MSVPSYDDLTPGIPDMAETRLAEQLGLLLRADLHRSTGDQQTARPNPPALVNSGLFACLRGRPRDVLLAVAKDFSPRLMRVSDGEVLLDVSGLGALIGEPPVIAQELRRALKEAGADA